MESKAHPYSAFRGVVSARWLQGHDLFHLDPKRWREWMISQHLEVIRTAEVAE